jgi:dynein heavy chain
MPAVELYGAQPPIELLRLLVDKAFLWDRRERYAKHISDTTLLCCSAPPGGGRAALSQRFTRHFNLLAFPQPDRTVLFKIFHSILAAFFEAGSFQQAVKQCSDGAVNASIDLYHRLQAEMLPVPAKFHYTFNLRDVSKVFQGLMMV